MRSLTRTVEVERIRALMEAASRPKAHRARFGDTPQEQHELDVIADLYRRGYSLRQIGRRLGMSHENVRLRLEAGHVPIRGKRA